MKTFVVCMITKDIYPEVARGLEIHVRKLSEKLADMGNSIIVISSSRPLSNNPSISEILIKTKGNGPITDIIFIMKSFFKVINIYKKQNMNVVHMHGPPSFKPVGEVIARLTGLRVVYTIHGSFNKSFRISILLKIFNKDVKMIAVSDEIKDKIINISDKILVTTISTGISIFQFNKNNGIDNNSKLILFVGNLSRDKGVHILIQSFKRVIHYDRDVKLLVIGNGPEMTSLVQLVKDHSLESNINFIGRVSSDSIPYYLSQANIFVAPSIATQDSVEGTPTCIIEAMAAGLPIIASNIGGIPSLITNDVNGELVEPNDEELLSMAIIKYLADPKKCREVSNNNIELAKKFDWDIIANNIFNYYQ